MDNVFGMQVCQTLVNLLGNLPNGLLRYISSFLNVILYQLEQVSFISVLHNNAEGIPRLIPEYSFVLSLY